MKSQYMLGLFSLLSIPLIGFGTARAIENSQVEVEPMKLDEVVAVDATPTKNSEFEKVGSEPSPTTTPANNTPNRVQSNTNAGNSITTSNATGLPDNISRYEWERQGGWKKLVEAAYLRAIERGVTPMCGDGMCNTVLYYKITAVATDPCYASLGVSLEVDGQTQMRVVGAELMSAPGAICDATRSQTISVPPLGTLTQYLLQVDAKYGLYKAIQGKSKPAGTTSSRLTRPQFTAQGGWERVARTALKNAKEYLATAQGSMVGRTSHSSELCFGSVAISLETLKVVGVSWDDAGTPTCDYVRNDHPPLPSIDYLNQYLQNNP